MTPLSTHRRRLRFRSQWGYVALLTVFWVAISGQFTPFGVVGGAVLAWLVTLAFPLPPLHYRGRPRPWGLVVLVVALVRDLAVASFTLAVQALHPHPDPKPGIVRVRLASDSDLYQVNTAELLSIVPGTIVIDARRRTRTLYLHVFDLSSQTPDAVRAESLAVEQRVLRALATRKERDAAAEASR